MKPIPEYISSVKTFVEKHILNKSVKANIIQIVKDLKQSLINLIKGIKLPNRKGWRTFFIHHLLATIAGFTAATLATDLVGNYFKYKSAENLWGLKGRKDGKTMITQDDFEVYTWWTKFIIGLIFMIVVRYFVMQMINEYEKIKEQRAASKQKPSS